MPDETLSEIFERFIDMEYSHIELVIGAGSAIQPDKIAAQHDSIVYLCRTSRQVTPVAIYFDLEPETSGFIEMFTDACKLAKACKIVVVSVRASVHGTPFNEEIDRLRELTQIALFYGVVVGVVTEAGRLTDTPETVGSICKTVKGLGVTLDPSHYIYNLPKPKDFETILPYVLHVRLRDTTEKQFQAKVGQGDVEFGRIVIQLNKADYRGALCVALEPAVSVDTLAELRKIRLLLESLL
ncbi:MAG: TIM barrel protein [Planctomycetaceae bacterium]|nr:TIM barrel protein [Planctomycetaceae bacterium]